MKLTSMRNKPMTPGWRGRDICRFAQPLLQVDWWVFESCLHPSQIFDSRPLREKNHPILGLLLHYHFGALARFRHDATVHRHAYAVTANNPAPAEWVRGLNCSRQNRQVIIHSTYNHKHPQTVSTNEPLPDRRWTRHFDIQMCSRFFPGS